MSHSPELMAGDWPPLPFPDWQETQETLHRWLQIVGKVKLELSPFLNEWWNVALAVTARGLATGPIPYGAGTFEITFDFIDHTLVIHTSAGQYRALPLLPRSVASFYAEFFDTLGSLGIEVAINPMPVEIVDPISCAVDHERDAYDADAVHRWWRILVGTERVLQRFRPRSSARAARFCGSGARSISPTFASPAGRRSRRRGRRASCSWRRIRRITPAASGRGTPTTPACC